jgi:hypothetical protein
MKLKISKRFVKDSTNITDQRILAKLRQVLLEAERAQTLAEIANLSELSGYPPERKSDDHPPGKLSSRPIRKGL